ncbi:hypothetical protein KJ750_01970 [Patescibacteria group bacterium]|nr:hypothetical protein [Patescibacteria group bacterium]
MSKKKVIIENIALEGLTKESKIKCDCEQKATIQLVYELRGKQKHCCSDLPCFIKAIVLLRGGDYSDIELTHLEIPNYIKDLSLHIFIR